MKLDEIKNSLLNSGVINKDDIASIENEAKHKYEQLKPTSIENWEQLKECESPTHYLEVNVEDGYGRIKNKNGETEWYLSTHTFYESQYKGSSKLLQECGFNVEVVSWG